MNIKLLTKILIIVCLFVSPVSTAKATYLANNSTSMECNNSSFAMPEDDNYTLLEDTIYTALSSCVYSDADDFLYENESDVEIFDTQDIIYEETLENFISIDFASVETISNSNPFVLDIPANLIYNGEEKLAVLNFTEDISLELINSIPPVNYYQHIDDNTLILMQSPPIEVGTYSAEIPGSLITFTIEQAYIEEDFENETLDSDTVFSDVSTTDWYYESVMWAVESGLISSETATIFGSSSILSRADVVTLLWRANGCPIVSVNNPFSDVISNDWYYNAVMWAVSEGITNGTKDGSVFSPYQDCDRSQITTMLYRMSEKTAVVETVVLSYTNTATIEDLVVEKTRAEVVSALWRESGCPIVSVNNPFSDVISNDWYYNAVMWAFSQGITLGTGDGTSFGADLICDETQFSSMVERMISKPTAETCSFSDVSTSDWFYDAVQWAVDEEITLGTGNGATFSPTNSCEKAEIITFLYRFLV